MTEFPELQQALVDAGRRRYGAAGRTWRVARPVLVAAACAAVVAVVGLAGTRGPDDGQPASPAVSPEPNALERAYAVFSRPATDADALPDVEGFRDNLLFRADQPGFDPSQTRLLAQLGDLRVYLTATPFDGRPGICTSIAVDGKYAHPGGCGEIDIGPVAPDFDGDPGADMVRDYSFTPSSGRPGAILLVVRNGIDAVTVEFADHSVRLPVRDNVVFATPLESWPLSIEWEDADGHRHTKPTATFPDASFVPDGFTVPPERIRPPAPPEDMTPNE